MFRATVTRSTAEPEEITAGAGAGYFALVWSSGGGLSRNIVGGAGALIGAIATELGGKVVKDAEVLDIVQEADLVRVRYRWGDAEHELRARHAIVATKAYDAARLVRDLPDDTSSALTTIPYGPTVVMAMLTNETRPMPWDDLYALATPKRAFNMLFNTVNVLRPRSAVRRPGGSLMVYRAAHAATEMMELPDTSIEQAFLDDLYAIYPEARGIVTETIVLKMPNMLPYAAPGRSQIQPALERPLGRVHLAGDYLGGVYTDTAISSGQEAALAVRTALQAAEATA
jgi:protoporphyrinogen/coproporphyrinogen III oxidase